MHGFIGQGSIWEWCEGKISSLDVSLLIGVFSHLVPDVLKLGGWVEGGEKEGIYPAV